MEGSSIDLFLFAVFTFLLGVVICLFLFFSSRVTGLIVSKLLSTFWVGNEGFISIGTLNLSLLTGRIFVGNVVYSTKNTCIRVVEGTLTIRWWRKTVRESAVVNEGTNFPQADQPCRLSINLSGVEYLVFNNSYRYNHLEEVLQKSDDGSVTIQQVVDIAKLVPVNQFVPPLFYRLFPATSILIRKGCLMLGNPELPTMLVATFNKGVGLYTTEEPRFQQFDYYKQVVNMDLMKTIVRLKPNPDYSGEEELAVDRPPNAEEY